MYVLLGEFFLLDQPRPFWYDSTDKGSASAADGSSSMTPMADTPPRDVEMAAVSRSECRVLSRVDITVSTSILLQNAGTHNSRISVCCREGDVAITLHAIWTWLTPVAALLVSMWPMHGSRGEIHVLDREHSLNACAQGPICLSH